MPYITSFERLAREEGEAISQIRTLQQNVVEFLDARFDRVPEGLKEAVEEIGDEAKLRRLIRAAAKCVDFEEFAENL